MSASEKESAAPGGGQVPPPPLRWLASHRAAAVFLFLVAVLCYANSIPNKWAVDDSLVVQKNRYVMRGWNGVDSLLLKDAFYGFYGADIGAVPGGRWRPLSPVLFALSAEAFAPVKKDASGAAVYDASGYRLLDTGPHTALPHILHALNVLLFALLCTVLYHLLLLLLGGLPGSEKAGFVAFAASLLFAVHPLHTEVVANVKSCDEILALLFALLALRFTLLAARSKRGGKGGRLAAAGGLFFLALLAKETAIAFIAIIPLAVWFSGSVKVKAIAGMLLPLLLVCGVYLGLRSLAVGSAGPAQPVVAMMNDPFLVIEEQAQYAPLVPGSPIRRLVSPSATVISRMPLSGRLATNLYTYALYLKLLVVPHPLTSDYYPRQIPVQSFSNPVVLFSILLHGFLLVWALRRMRSRHPLAFGILFCYLSFALVSNLFFPIGTNMAERFMFVPSAGFCLCAAWLLYQLVERAAAAKRAAVYRTVAAGFGAVCLVFALLTIVRNPQWKNNYTLFSHDVQVSENSGKIRSDLAAIILARAVGDEDRALAGLKRGSAAASAQQIQAIRKERNRLIETALPLLQRALKVDPIWGTAWIQLGKAYSFLAQDDSQLPQQSLTYLLTALAAYRQAEVYCPLGARQSLAELQNICYQDIRKLMGQQYGDASTAVAYLEKARGLTPDDPQVYFLLGAAYALQGNRAKAIECIQWSLKLKPAHPEAGKNLELLLEQP